MVILFALWSILLQLKRNCARLLISGRPTQAPAPERSGRVTHASIDRIIRGTCIDGVSCRPGHRYQMLYTSIEFDPDSQQVIVERMREMDPEAEVTFVFQFEGRSYQ